MTISRYKIMAGILGVSLGGLAAVAGQCPSPGTTFRSGDPAPNDGKAPSAGSKPSALPAVPPPPVDVPPPPPTSPVAVDLPALPALPAPPAAAAPAKLPDLPPITPVKAEMPKPAALPTPVVIPASGNGLPDLTPAALRSELAAPAAPPKVAEPLPSTPTTTPALPPSTPPAPLATPPAPAVLTPAPSAPTVGLTPPAAAVPNPIAEPVRQAPAPIVDTAPVRQVSTAPASTPATPAASRFRILLRVGEGEPVFEVKSGDDLVLRVVCEKVDVKSPEKGQGPSSVTASGKVRFVGFGAEGSCDNLSFLAGTGEVAMTGTVRVQVKDKIGRVESELTSDRLQYRLDASNHLPGTMRP
jgi:hypothetical protein